MSISIFQVDTEEVAKESADDLVGRFRSGYQLNGNPKSLKAFRVTSEDKSLLSKLADELGHNDRGVSEWDTKSSEKYEIFTEAKTLDVVFDGPKSIKSSMVLWGSKGKVRECDGIKQTDDKHSDCACPSDLGARKAAARKGNGCQPSVQLYFRLRDYPELGKFSYYSGSWGLAKAIGTAEADLEEIGGPAHGTIHLKEVSFMGTDEETGLPMEVKYTLPEVKITGAEEVF